MRFLGFIITLFSLTLALKAQVPVGGTVQAQLAFFALGDAKTYEGVLLRTGGKVMRAPTALNNRSAKFKYSGPAQLVLFREVVVEKVKTEVPVGTVTVGADINEALVFLSPVNGLIQAFVVDMSPKRVAEGAVCLVNLTSINMALAINNSPVMMEPGRPVVVGPFPVGGVATEVKAAYAVGDKWISCGDLRMVMRPNARGILIVQNPVAAVEGELVRPRMDLFFDYLPKVGR